MSARERPGGAVASNELLGRNLEHFKEKRHVDRVVKPQLAQPHQDTAGMMWGTERRAQGHQAMAMWSRPIPPAGVRSRSRLLPGRPGCRRRSRCTGRRSGSTSAGGCGWSWWGIPSGRRRSRCSVPHETARNGWMPAPRSSLRLPAVSENVTRTRVPLPFSDAMDIWSAFFFMLGNPIPAPNPAHAPPPRRWNTPAAWRVRCLLCQGRRR